jgi:hypothetical protein
MHLLWRASVSLVAFSRLSNRVFTSGEGRDLVLVTVAFATRNREFRGRARIRKAGASLWLVAIASLQNPYQLRSTSQASARMNGSLGACAHRSQKDLRSAPPDCAGRRGLRQHLFSIKTIICSIGSKLPLLRTSLSARTNSPCGDKL